MPRLEGQAKIGHFCYATETIAPGTALARIAFSQRKSAHLRKTLQSEIPRCVRVAVSIAKLLRHKPADPAPACYWEPPEGVGLAEDVRVRRALPADWVQHGDFTVENIFIDRGGNISVVDWEHVFRGGSPLHDSFTLLVSLLPAVEVRAGQGLDAWAQQFETAFFGSGFWSERVREWISSACHELDIPVSQVWPMFIEFLLFQYHHRHGLGLHGASQAQLYERFLRIAAGQPGRFVMPSR